LQDKGIAHALFIVETLGFSIGLLGIRIPELNIIIIAYGTQLSQDIDPGGIVLGSIQNMDKAIDQYLLCPCPYRCKKKAYQD
jgi:hypothetical protein